jgi:hypothetical protein
MIRIVVPPLLKLSFQVFQRFQVFEIIRPPDEFTNGRSPVFGKAVLALEPR